MHEGEGLPPSEIDRLTVQSRNAISAAMESRHDVTDRDQRHAAGNAVWRAHCVLKALHTLDTAFPRVANQNEPIEPIEPIEPVKQTAQDNSLSTSESRALLSGLEALLPLAESVDKQHGYTLPESIQTAPGETRGTDFAERISELMVWLRGETFGEPGQD